MEESQQKDNHDDHNSRFLKWKWWRPVYYIYFMGMVVAVIFLYSAQEHKEFISSSASAAQTNQSTTNSKSGRSTLEKGSSPSPELGAQTAEQEKSSQGSAEAKGGISQPKPDAGTSHVAATSAGSEYAFMIAPSEETVEKGKTLFMNDCVACHGANGEGDGPAAAALKPKPRDFHSPKGWINGRTASGIFKTLAHGIPGSAMPPFSTISVKDRLDIISYIRSFKGFPKETKADIQLLTKMINEAGNSGQAND